MHCIEIIDPGPHSQLRLVEQAMPRCGNQQVLIKVNATALNRADLMQRQGKYPPPPGESAIPGLEVAGEVITIGQDVTRFKLGDKIYGLVGSGGYATHCLVHQNLAELVPKNWDYIYAAALPEALITAHSTLFMQGQLQSGQSLLIHAAGSGISTLAIQMAALSQAQIITTASNEQKMAQALRLGASQVINYKKEDFAEIIAANSLDLVIDFIGGNYFAKHLALLKPQGRLIQIACMQGHRVELDLALLMRKRLNLEGFVLRSQSLAEKTLRWQSAHQCWGEAIAKQQLKPVIAATFNFNEIDKAQQYMLSGSHFGKIVILVD